MRQLCFGRLGFFLVLLLVVNSAPSQITPMDTTAPNQFEFTSVRYFASKGTTNAAVTVHFAPGNRSWSGSVNYLARDGTAISNQDYTPVSGLLSFSGTSYRSFTVPLIPGSSNQQKTIFLFLTPGPSDPNATITRSNAVLNINLPPPPNVEITAGQNGSVVVWWSDDDTDAFLEKLTPPGTNWSALSAGFADGHGLRYCTDVPCDGMALYRLRRLQ